MTKHQHVANRKEGDVLTATLAKVEEEKLPIEDMPLETLRDYRFYNEEARKINKRARVCRYPIKQCPTELHPTQRIKFGNNDKSMNPVKIFVSNHLIHYDESFYPGKIYDVPECIVSYLADKGYPVWGWVSLPDGSRETRMTGKQPRFSITTVYQED